MDARRTTLPNHERVQHHADDARPAWLWSGDGQRLIWSNAAAGLFLARLKKHGLKRAAPAVPIRGQVARIIRLGSKNRSSLARIQFLAGEKPVSATCATTPLDWSEGETALLVVAVDPIAPEILAAAAEEAPAPLPSEATEALDDIVPSVPVADLPEASDAYAHELESWQASDAETAYEGEVTAPPAGPEARTPDDDPAAWQAALDDGPTMPRPETDAAAAAGPVQPGDAGEGQDEESAEPARRLSDLVTRLLADDALFTPLTEADDTPPSPAEPPVIADAAPENGAGQVLYRIVGRGFVADAGTAEDASAPAPEESGDETDPAQRLEAAIEQLQATQPADTESVERVSRYNFDELSRILNDRIGERNQSAAEPSVPTSGTAPALPAGNAAGSLINLGGETLVLNRLPLGILVFRDQQILFANRAITEMIGYDSVESLRHAGLGAVFPAAGPEGQEAGPVNHLVQRDGTLVPVTARLQSISWQGRPALMLSASATEVRTGHEDAVRAFAEGLAELRGDGFIAANRNGTISAGNAMAATLLAGGKPLSGRTLAGLVSDEDVVALQAFLERPARFAETARPALTLRTADGRADILLFALGQAGILSGYFGFVRGREALPARAGKAQDIDPALLARISRGVRRPLNTIIGFSDLIRSEAFGALGNERYEGYADDISRAGQEIAALVDELDDYTRLREGRYLPQRASLDLTALLESCVVRIRNQANAGRVIVRNAISETLPRVTADRPSLAQAVLNLLASAIDQTPTGGAVVISAQRLDDGGIAIHVRDSSAHAVDMAERFVVFRDGTDKAGQALAPVRSSVGLALTRSLLAVNAVSLSVDPAGREGMLFSLRIPADLVERTSAPPEEQKS